MPAQGPSSHSWGQQKPVWLLHQDRCTMAALLSPNKMPLGHLSVSEGLFLIMPLGFKEKKLKGPFLSCALFIAFI